MARRAPPPRSGYPSDVSDDEWALVAPYLTLNRADSAHRQHDLRGVFNALRYLVRTGAPWRWLPRDLPPWPAVYQQAQRWIRAGCFEALVHDLRVVLRTHAGRGAQPTAAGSRRRSRLRDDRSSQPGVSLRMAGGSSRMPAGSARRLPRPTARRCQCGWRPSRHPTTASSFRARGR